MVIITPVWFCGASITGWHLNKSIYKAPEANLRFGFGFIYNLVWLSNRSKYDWGRVQEDRALLFLGGGQGLYFTITDLWLASSFGY